jgi:hypothetical protein
MGMQLSNREQKIHWLAQVVRIPSAPATRGLQRIFHISVTIQKEKERYLGRSNVVSKFKHHLGSFFKSMRFLPVHLTYFNAKRPSGNSVTLTWQTAQELIRAASKFRDKLEMEIGK